MDFYLRHSCKFNDLFIELSNSLVNGALPTNMTITTEDIPSASAKVVMKHNILKSTKQEVFLTGNIGSNGEGEIRIEENRCRITTSIGGLERLSAWVLNHIGHLQTFDTPPSLVVEGTKRYENMNTVNGIIERGKDITINKIIPEYIDYFKKTTSDTTTAITGSISIFIGNNYTSSFSYNRFHESNDCSKGGIP